MDSTANFAKAQVSTGYDASATSIALATGGGDLMPSTPFNATWWNVTDYPDACDDPDVEIVRVTNRTGDTLTITRAQEGTAATAKNVTDKSYILVAGLTAKTMSDISSEIAAKASASHTHAESDVTNLTTDLAARPTLAQVMARTLGS